MSSVRTTQTATNELFQAVSKFSSEIPLIVIATKKDELFATKWQEARGKYKNAPDLMATCDKYADDEVMLRLSVIEDEMEQVRHGRLDACVAVSKGKNSLSYVPCFPLLRYIGVPCLLTMP